MCLEKMYHCTKRENLKKILKQGLQPKKPKFHLNSIKGVYLSKAPFTWMFYVTRGNTQPGALIEVNVEGLDLHIDKNSAEVDEQIVDDYKTMTIENVEFCQLAEKYAEADRKERIDFVYPGSIPVDRFMRISVSSKENPMHFEEYKRGEVVC